MTRNYIHFKEPYQFVQGNISSFNETYSLREIISIQGNMFNEGTHIRSSSRPYAHSRKLYLLRRVSKGGAMGANAPPPLPATGRKSPHGSIQR